MMKKTITETRIHGKTKLPGGLPSNAVRNEQDGPIRTAAYCRVSSMSAGQEDSFETQKRFYEMLIQSDSRLCLAGIYGDHGVSAGSMKKRTDFLRMMEDCQNGAIDFILTKSISRFARNLSDCTECIQVLTELGIPVFFENEGIHTMSHAGELLLSVLSAIAQEELNEKSRSIQWAYQKNSRLGRPTMRTPYGYRKEPERNGIRLHQWIPWEPEAQKVRQIFQMASEGCSLSQICAVMNSQEENPGIVWRIGRIRGILTHEAYVGDLCTGKYITVDYLNKKQIRNHGLADQYYLKDHHPPLISREQFCKIQKRFPRHIPSEEGGVANVLLTE